MASSKFNASGFAMRFVFALVLVFATYNPEGYSYFHWVKDTFANEGFKGFSPLLVLAGVVLLIGWLIVVRATARSLGPHGFALAGGIFAALIWSLTYYDLVSLNSFSLMAYLVMVGLSFVLAVGLSWSHVRRRLTGQLDVDDIEN